MRKKLKWNIRPDNPFKKLKMRKYLKWNISIFMQAIIRLCFPVVYLAQIIPITCWICNIPHLAHLDLSPYMA